MPVSAFTQVSEIGHCQILFALSGCSLLEVQIKLRSDSNNWEMSTNFCLTWLFNRQNKKVVDSMRWVHMGVSDQNLKEKTNPQNEG